MEKLLQKYCKLNSIKVEDIKGNSHAKGLPTHRHIYAYCIRKQYPSVRLWQIGKVINKSQILYGIRLINNLLKPFKKKSKIPPEIKIIKERIEMFLELCSEYKRSDLKLPEKDD